MRNLLASVAIAAATVSTAFAEGAKPTVVLVHGAFAGTSSWNGVVEILLKDGYPVVAMSNPLRGVQSDADYVSDTVASIKSPVVLVGHSYGGAVISAAAKAGSNVKALVFVAGIAPDIGETTASLSGKFPGGTLGPTLAPPVPLSSGGNDLYIQQDKFHAQFAADVPVAAAMVLAATQRPVTDTALNEPQASAAWKDIPSWFIYGDLDKNIPAAAQEFMAKRAKARKVTAVKGASHMVMVTNPRLVADVIEEAAKVAMQP